jgi:hypothetical protein
VSGALAAGAAHLAARQGRDGTWRDYDLPPGASDAWVTAVAGTALACAAPGSCADAISRARAALLLRRRPGGWGYNAAAACDADSTAWAVRLLGAGTALLGPYLDRDGHAHTFADRERFGSWSWRHADVTAAAGLALARTGPAWAQRQVRAACLSTQREDGGWRAFWWSDDAYATWSALNLLAVTGGVPPSVATRARGFLAGAGDGAHALGAALRLGIAGLLGAPVGRRRCRLIALQRPDGGWPGSSALLVPDQLTGAPGEPHADDGVLTTAVSLLALSGGERTTRRRRQHWSRHPHISLTKGP